jgi:hypothetical protein
VGYKCKGMYLDESNAFKIKDGFSLDMLEKYINEEFYNRHKYDVKDLVKSLLVLVICPHATDQPTL